MNIDKKKIQQRFAEIDAALEEIKKIISFGDEKILSDKIDLAALKYNLLQAIEAVGGVYVHLAAKKFHKAVSAFGECFEVLENEKALQPDLSLKLRNMVKFRNKLIHRYWEINDKNILEYAKNDLSDFEDFMQAISNLFLK
ncbi:MAG: HepT-like ribonuclease domain-containing protein [Patescibacteria group bacterium]